MSTTYATHPNPTWWDTQNDSAWGRVKAAFKRDWDQTKHDFGGDEPETRQNINRTVNQAAGKEAIPPRHEPTFEDIEPAFRYGYGARHYYGEDYPEWDDELEAVLKQEWSGLEPSRRAQWEADREAIQRAWEFDESDEV